MMVCGHCGYKSEVYWFDACPKCGKGGPVGAELMEALSKIKVPLPVIFLGLAYLLGRSDYMNRRRKRHKKPLQRSKK
jgi:hypothetical protein